MPVRFSAYVFYKEDNFSDFLFVFLRKQTPSKLEAQVGQKLLTWIRLIMRYVTLCHGGHLGYQIQLPLAIQNLMLFEDFQDCHHGHHLGYWN